VKLDRCHHAYFFEKKWFVIKLFNGNRLEKEFSVSEDRRGLLRRSHAMSGVFDNAVMKRV